MLEWSHLWDEHTWIAPKCHKYLRKRLCELTNYVWKFTTSLSRVHFIPAKITWTHFMIYNLVSRKFPRGLKGRISVWWISELLLQLCNMCPYLKRAQVSLHLVFCFLCETVGLLTHNLQCSGRNFHIGLPVLISHSNPLSLI